MAIKISELTKDASFRDDDYLIKDGTVNGTRTISVQNAANELGRMSTTGLKRASLYDEATTIEANDYLVNDNATAPRRITAANAATSLAQLAEYQETNSIDETDYIFKSDANGTITKVDATEAAGDLFVLAGEMAGSEMLEEAIARGIVDQAMNNAITQTVPTAVQELRTELSQPANSTAIVNGALGYYSEDSSVDPTDLFVKRNAAGDATSMVTPDKIIDGALTDVAETDLVDTDDSVLIKSATDGFGEVGLEDMISHFAQNTQATDVPGAVIDYASQHIPLDTTQASTTTDGALYDAIDKNGWGAVISNQLMDLKALLTKVLDNALIFNNSASATVASQYSNANIKNLTLSRYGKTVYATLALEYINGTTITPSTTIWSIPEGYRPYTSIGRLVMAYRAGASSISTAIKITSVAIGANGDVSLATSNATSFYGTATWQTEQ